jgi:hypothetical protein
VAGSGQFLKYGCLSIIVQFLACVIIWIAAVTFAPMFNPLFEKMLYFYWPVTYVLVACFGSSGESAMIALPVFGVVLGMIVYGVVIGLIIGYFKGIRSKSGNG